MADEVGGETRAELDLKLGLTDVTLKGYTLPRTRQQHGDAMCSQLTTLMHLGHLHSQTVRASYMQLSIDVINQSMVADYERRTVAAAASRKKRKGLLHSSAFRF